MQCVGITGVSILDVQVFLPCGFILNSIQNAVMIRVLISVVGSSVSQYGLPVAVIRKSR